MKLSKIGNGIIFSLFAALTLSLCIPQTVFCQKEKLGIVKYTPPKGWTKTAKVENVVAFSDIKQTGQFCIITLYGATPGAGSPTADFAREWNNLVVKTMKAKANPPTETQAADGWTVIGGASAVEEGVAFLTFSAVSEKPSAF